VRFFSLQQGEAANDILPTGESAVIALSALTREIAAAASAIQELDLVISVDAMLAHLAGTLGRPTWLLLKHEADWRWMQARCDSPWYPGMRLFRQTRPHDWHSVVVAVAKALGRYAATQTHR
jgi:ADP-heptose:LPS heptosyltransferase